MKVLRRWLLILVCCAGALLMVNLSAGAARVVAGDRPELAYLEQVNSWRPPSDPQLIFLLMAQFANANRHAEGVAFFEDLRRRFDPQLNDGQRAMYLTAVAVLRAGHANDVSLLKRYSWVRDTVRMLDAAEQLTHGEAFVMRWMSGVVRAQLPGFFGERDAALTDLTWCLSHADKAPQANWLREVHFYLAAVYRQRGDLAQAQREQTLSGYTETTKPALFTTALSGDAFSGYQFSPRAIREVVPGTVYALSGFEFTEYYFIVSANRRELIAIDAGSRPDAAREALEALRAQVPALPPLTTVFITHSHWDHVGGWRYFRSMNPALRFIARANYTDELALDAEADPATLKQFFGRGFRFDDVLAFRADVTIAEPTEMTVGGTRFTVQPARGGETDDALLINMPDHGVLFAGDILMPYLGAPFVNEGSLDGMLAGIDQVNALKPRLLLQGHETLTRLFDSTLMLSDLRVQLVWLRDRVASEMAKGTTRAALQQANLVPPTLEQSSASVHLAYLVLRENAIDRLFQQHSGYWQNGLQGLDVLSDADRGAVLIDYLGLSESQVLAAVDRMVSNGRYELAASTLREAQARLPPSDRLSVSRRLVYLKLMEKVQDFDPYKFIIYSGQIDQTTAQMNTSAGSASNRH
jgi:glyoxylase-like metal-dependent hydrolase (beta-lactamase superfamily II)